MSAQKPVRVYVIREHPGGGWTVDVGGRLPGQVFPTAVAAQEAIRETEQKAAAEGGIQVARIEWNPTTSVGIAVVRAITDHRGPTVQGPAKATSQRSATPPNEASATEGPS
jgi:hypothetical protein